MSSDMLGWQTCKAVILQQQPCQRRATSFEEDKQAMWEVLITTEKTIALPASKLTIVGRAAAVALEHGSPSGLVAMWEVLITTERQ